MPQHRVLVVDDDPYVREALVEVLGEHGFVVDAVGNGPEALAWLERENDRTCLVLLDLMMPFMDGEEFLTAKEAHPDLTHLPVVVITASGASTADTVLKGHRICQCLLKPIPLSQLLAAVSAWCPRER